jgi:hypothetical protein
LVTAVEGRNRDGAVGTLTPAGVPTLEGHNRFTLRRRERRRRQLRQPVHPVQAEQQPAGAAVAGGADREGVAAVTAVTAGTAFAEPADAAGTSIGEQRAGIAAGPAGLADPSAWLAQKPARRSLQKTREIRDN